MARASARATFGFKPSAAAPASSAASRQAPRTLATVASGATVTGDASSGGAPAVTPVLAPVVALRASGAFASCRRMRSVARVGRWRDR